MLGNKMGKHLKLFPNWQKVFFFCKTIVEIYKTNTYVKEYQHVFQKCGRGEKCGRGSFVWFWGRLKWAKWAKKLALRLCQ